MCDREKQYGRSETYLYTIIGGNLHQLLTPPQFGSSSLLDTFGTIKKPENST